LARVVFRDARIYLIQLLTKIRHTLSQRQSLNTDKEHLRKMVRGMFWLMLLIISAKMAYSLWRYFSFSAEYTAVSSSANKPLRADAKPFGKNDVPLVLSAPTKLVWQISPRRRTGKTTRTCACGRNAS